VSISFPFATRMLRLKKSSRRNGSE
jgi:hypothetical protein